MLRQLQPSDPNWSKSAVNNEKIRYSRLNADSVKLKEKKKKQPAGMSPQHFKASFNVLAPLDFDDPMTSSTNLC